MCPLCASFNLYVAEIGKVALANKTRQVYNLFQEPVEQPTLGFSIAEEKIRQF